MKKLIFIILFAAPLFVLSAQSADDYFHMTANLYVKGEKQKAKDMIQEAIKKYPNDKTLKQLAGKVNKLPDDKKNQNKQNQSKTEKQQQEQQQEQQQKQQQQMSKDNAQQILDALQQDEKNAQEKAKKQQVRGVKKAEKDW